jgi:sugar lactone lactonase YvrE
MQTSSNNITTSIMPANTTNTTMPTRTTRIVPAHTCTRTCLHILTRACARVRAHAFTALATLATLAAILLLPTPTALAQSSQNHPPVPRNPVPAQTLSLRNADGAPARLTFDAYAIATDPDVLPANPDGTGIDPATAQLLRITAILPRKVTDGITGPDPDIATAGWATDLAHGVYINAVATGSTSVTVTVADYLAADATGAALSHTNITVPIIISTTTTGTGGNNNNNNDAHAPVPRDPMHVINIPLTAGAQTSFTAADIATDPDNDTIIITAIVVQPGAAVAYAARTATGQIVIAATSAARAGATSALIVTVADTTGLTTNITVPVAITNTVAGDNNPPLARADVNPAQTLPLYKANADGTPSPTTIIIAAASLALDPDNHPLHFGAIVTPPDYAIVAADLQADGTLALHATGAGATSLTVTIADINNAGVNITIPVTVTPGAGNNNNNNNPVPIASLPAPTIPLYNETGNPGAILITASDLANAASPGDTLAIAAIIKTNPDGSTIPLPNPAVATAAITSAGVRVTATGPGTTALTVTVANLHNGTVTGTINITINITVTGAGGGYDNNHPPVSNPQIQAIRLALDDDAVPARTTLRATDLATSPDGIAPRITGITTLPNAAIANASFVPMTGATAAFVTINANGAGTTAMVLSIANAAGATIQITIPIRVEDYRNPNGGSGGNNNNNTDTATTPPPAAPGGVTIGVTGTAAAAPADIFISDPELHIIYIAESGTLRLLAGLPGVPGRVDGTGTAARFNTPIGLSINKAGRLLVADSGNNALRYVTAGGVVSTYTFPPDKLMSAPAGLASRDPAAPTGETYVADTRNHLIKKLTATGDVEIIAGSGTAGHADGPLLAASFNNPNGVAVDIAGNLYIADTQNHTIRYIDTTAGAVITLAGQPGVPGADDGPAATATFNTPSALVVDGAGAVYVADTANHRIREIITISGTLTVRTLAGGETTPAPSPTPTPMAKTPATTAAAPAAAIAPAPAAAAAAAPAGDFADGAGAAARFDSPRALALAPDGSLLVADTGNAALRVIADDEAATVTTLALQTAAPDDGGGTGDTTNPPPKTGGGGGGGATPLLFLMLLLLALARRLTQPNKQQ